MKTICLLLCFAIVKVSTKCPCQNASLCETISDTNRKEIYVFSLQNKMSSWVKFDWAKVTTVVTVGYFSTDLMCLAHQKGSRVIAIANYKTSDLTNAALRAEWVKKQIMQVEKYYYDGINIDYEDPILQNETTLRDAYTSLVRESYLAFKQANPRYQVTVDVAWSPDCIDSRCYDYKGLANVTDFLFVMSYDEQSQIYGDKCLALANSGYRKTMQGVNEYLKLGIKSSQLVLGVPWYGYKYPCVSLEKDTCSIRRVPFRGVNCSDAAGSQVDYRLIYPLINTSTSGRQWDPDAQSPFFNFKDPSSGQMYQFRYDDPESLSIKYNAAIRLQLRGVGTWNIDCLDYSDEPSAVQKTKEMFDAFPDYPRFSWH